MIVLGLAIVGVIAFSHTSELFSTSKAPRGDAQGDGRARPVAAERAWLAHLASLTFLPRRWRDMGIGAVLTASRLYQVSFNMMSTLRLTLDMEAGQDELQSRLAE